MKPYLGNKAIQWDHIDIIDMPLVAMSISDMERFRLRCGDLLVCEGGEVGRAAIWESQIDECYYQKALHRLRPKRGFNPRLMLAFLRYWTSHDMISEYVSQTSIAHLTQEKLSIVPLPAPSCDEQTYIIEKLLAHDQKVGSEERALAKLKSTKSALMDDLLTGRVRVTALLSGESPVSEEPERKSE